MTKAPTEDERVVRLVQQFQLAAEHAYTASARFNNPAQHRAVRRANSIAKELDSIPPGRRSSLAALLTHEHPGVRCFAAIYVSDIMRQRAMAVLREVRAVDRGGPAGWPAAGALFDLERGEQTINPDHW